MVEFNAAWHVSICTGTEDNMPDDNTMQSLHWWQYIARTLTAPSHGHPWQAHQEKDGACQHLSVST